MVTTHLVLKARRTVEACKKFCDVLLLALQRRCPHTDLSYFGGTDYTFSCNSCGREWYDEVPKLVRTFSHGGKGYHLDGEGGCKQAA